MKGIFDINWLFYKYYSDNPELKRIVTIHSAMVAKKALEIKHKKNLPLCNRDIYCAAMLHDIGVVKCNAPGIFAHGSLPYLQHGIEGEKILKENGLEKYAKVCSTHTGAGITAENIRKNSLPLPEKDFLPSSLLEKLICYADKFFSKSDNLMQEKNLEDIKNQMITFGEDSYKRFMQLHKLFS